MFSGRLNWFRVTREWKNRYSLVIDLASLFIYSLSVNCLLIHLCHCVYRSCSGDDVFWSRRATCRDASIGQVDCVVLRCLAYFGGRITDFSWTLYRQVTVLFLCQLICLLTCSVSFISIWSHTGQLVSAAVPN